MFKNLHIYEIFRQEGTTVLPVLPLLELKTKK